MTPSLEGRELDVEPDMVMLHGAKAVSLSFFLGNLSFHLNLNHALLTEILQTAKKHPRESAPARKCGALPSSVSLYTTSFIV